MFKNYELELPSIIEAGEKREILALLKEIDALLKVVPVGPWSHTQNAAGRTWIKDIHDNTVQCFDYTNGSFIQFFCAARWWVEVLSDIVKIQLDTNINQVEAAYNIGFKHGEEAAIRNTF